MARSQFTFYESFYRSISRIKKVTDRVKAYDALCAYALYGELPDLDSAPDSVASFFESIKPILDSAAKKAAAGKKGGSAKQAESTGKQPEASESKSEATGSKLEATRSKLEARNRNRASTSTSTRTNVTPYSPPPTTEEATNVSAVVSDYLNRINPSASRASLEELAEYANEMGKDVCLRAFDVALDAKKATWPYIRAILRSKRDQGVKCLADWEAAEQKRTGSKQTPEPAGTVPTSDIDHLFDMARAE